jgi:hypothetical protein
MTHVTAERVSGNAARRGAPRVWPPRANDIERRSHQCVSIDSAYGQRATIIERAHADRFRATLRPAHAPMAQ